MLGRGKKGGWGGGGGGGGRDMFENVGKEKGPAMRVNGERIGMREGGE